MTISDQVVGDNPLADNSPGHEDQQLVLGARSAERKALEALVERHSAWIYNITVRMLYHRQDAEDATQEILIKVLTRLSSFEGRSSFRTWLYRIVVNHVLNMRRGRVEPASMNFASYGAGLDDTPDLELADPMGTSADSDLLVAEAMITCTTGMLQCLDRKQRVTFILGAIFGVSDTVAADVLEITPDNFRQRLARARRDLRNFMDDKCGLVNQANPCRCAKKTRSFIQAGYVDPENLLFVRERIGAIPEVVPSAHETLNTLDGQCTEIFRGHPFYMARPRADAAAAGREPRSSTHQLTLDDGPNESSRVLSETGRRNTLRRGSQRGLVL
jgi:RNA polymerase sigma factor (sigma-70 family)